MTDPAPQGLPVRPLLCRLVRRLSRPLVQLLSPPLSNLLDAPHRLCFAAAAALWGVASLAWALQVVAATGLGGSLPAGSVQRHAQVFVLGPMPLFIAGFLFTAGPRWLRAPAVPARRLLAGVATVLGGWLLVIAAAALPGAGGAAPGLALCTLGWCLLLRRLGHLLASASGRQHLLAPASSRQRLLASAGRKDQLHFMLAAASCAVLTLILGFSAVLAWLDGPRLAALARALVLSGLWWGVVAVFVIASDRLLPFLGHGLGAWIERRWPRAGLWLMLTGAWIAGAASWLPAAAPQWLADLVCAHAAAVAVVSTWLLLHWRRQAATRAPMLAMLLRAFGWWALAWAGMALAQARGLDPAMRGLIASAALHALTLGFLGGTMLAMVTRVAATHGGQARAIDRWARGLEGLLQLVVVARVLAALWPAAAPVMLALAAAGWAAVALLWTARHARELI